jgi:thiosulfate dehydrogenase [quinone] large subunit
MANEKLYDHVATLLLRLLLGVLFLSAGLGKFGDLAGFRQYIHAQFDATFLGGPLLTVFAYLLPFVEVLIGALLVLGLQTRPVLALTALTLLVLFFGLMVKREPLASQNALYFVIAVYALRNAKDNQFSVDHLIYRGG